MFHSSAIILRTHRQSCVTISQTFATVSAFRGVEGRHLLKNPEDSHVRSNFLNHPNTIKNPCTRENIVTIISLFYQLESFTRSFARLETKLKVRYLLHGYELPERYAQYKIFNTLEHD
jgi:hypothetical protein